MPSLVHALLQVMGSRPMRLASPSKPPAVQTPRSHWSNEGSSSQEDEEPSPPAAAARYVPERRANGLPVRLCAQLGIVTGTLGQPAAVAAWLSWQQQQLRCNRCLHCRLSHLLMAAPHEWPGQLCCFASRAAAAVIPHSHAGRHSDLPQRPRHPRPGQQHPPQRAGAGPAQRP